MGRKLNYAEKPVKGPGKKTRKQPAPKFSKKLLGRGEFVVCSGKFFVEAGKLMCFRI